MLRYLLRGRSFHYNHDFTNQDHAPDKVASGLDHFDQDEPRDELQEHIDSLNAGKTEQIRIFDLE